MKANEANLLKFLQGPKQFLIPIFQRRYSWEKHHCEQLWRDVLRVGQDKSTQSHFLGAIVCMEHGIYSASTVPELLVIDGQQRLTTLSLLLLALGRAIEAQNSKIDITRRKLENYYLFNADEDGEYRYKQRLTRHDNDTLMQLLDNKELPADTSHRLEENYRFFEAKLKDTDLKAVYEGIQKLTIVDISLNRDYDNPQLIFESLNFTGIRLSQADLIRNYVLMGQESDIQNRLYETYWYPMEQSFGTHYAKRFDLFIRDYLTLKTQQIPNKGKVYESFKRYVADKKHPEALEAIIKEIVHYSKHYVRIALLKEEDRELRACLEDIHALGVEVTFPFLLGVYEDYTQKQLEKAEVIEILRLIESYIFRRSILSIETRGLNKIFATLMPKINKANYLESLKLALAQMHFSQRYPSDTEFKEKFLVKDVYNLRTRNYLLRKLENDGRKEPIRVEDYTIEHVMPQRLSEKWQAELGEDWREVHEKYLHTIGNLTLTGYNPELSNNTLIDKQLMEGGFLDSPLRLNESLREVEQWDKDAIVDRAEKLSEKACKIWPNHGVPREIQQEQKVQQEQKGGWVANHPHLADEKGELFEQLRRRIRNLDASVRERINKGYITYSTNNTNKIFIDITPQAKRICLKLRILFPDIDDPRGWCTDVRNGGWVKVRISAVDDLGDIMSLINQAFEKQITDKL